MDDANDLLGLPIGANAVGRRWLANELAMGLMERVGLRPHGPPTILLRDLLARAWDQGRSPTLDELLSEALEGDGPLEVPPLYARLDLALRFVVEAPEFGGGPPEPRFGQRAAAARAATCTP